MPEQKWYAIHTRSSHEKSVASRLLFCDHEVFLPLYGVTHRWKNRCTKRLELPLFPGYVFARFPLDDRVAVLNTPGVSSIVGVSRNPLPIEDAVIESLRSGLHLRQAEPHPHIAVGDRVRISAGPLSGMEGIILRDKSRVRVVLCLELIMRSVAVEVNVDEIELVEADRSRRSMGF